MNKPPAFQFYPKDWLSDGNVASMTHEQKGIYITLLCHCWLEGFVPASVETLARMVQVDRKRMDELWPSISACFRRRGPKLIHLRLMKERSKQRAWREKSSLGGKRAARRRNATKGGSTTLIANGARVVQPKGNTSVFSLQSAVSGLLDGQKSKSGAPGDFSIDRKNWTDLDWTTLNALVMRLKLRAGEDWPGKILTAYLAGWGDQRPGNDFLARELSRLIHKCLQKNGVKSLGPYALESVKTYHRERVSGYQGKKR